MREKGVNYLNLTNKIGIYNENKIKLKYSYINNVIKYLMDS